MYKLTSRENIQRLIAHDSPERIGWDFNHPFESDFIQVDYKKWVAPENPYSEWGKHEELIRLTGFSGEVRRDDYGNIYGRFNGLTKGECIRGVIQDWEEDFEKFSLPEPDPTYREELLRQNFAASDKYVVAYGSSLFSLLRDARLMANALADTVLEPEWIGAMMDRIVEREKRYIKLLAGCGIDAMFICDDWGIQDRTFISPESFKNLFKPWYAKVADALHEVGMKYIVHSCGYNMPFMEDFLDAGIDVLQFDQPDAYPAEALAERYGKRTVFWSPVDIQKVLPTGNRELIENRALEMCNMFKAVGGGWIAKDYPSYADIGVDEQWAKWAMDVIQANSRL